MTDIKQIVDHKTFWKRSTMEIITYTEGSLADIIQLARKDILSLITTIESQQEKHREELQVLMNSSNTKIWNLQDDVKQKDALIESQKEEIERLNEIIRTLGLSLQNALPQEGDK